MSTRSGIEWTESTWNPLTGCTKVSPGCKNCLSPQTRILYADMTWRPIGNAKVGDQVVAVTDNLNIGTNRKVEVATIDAVWASKKPAIELIVGDCVIICSEDHRWLADVRPWWRFTKNLNLGVRLRTLGDPDRVTCTDSAAYRAGYIAGVTLGDGTMRWDRTWRSDKHGFPQSYWRVALVADDRIVLERLVAYLQSFDVGVNIRNFDSGSRNPKHKQMVKVETRALSNLAIITNLCKEQNELEWKAGWLAGMYDAEGGYNKNVRIAQKDCAVLEQARQYAVELGCVFEIEQFPKQQGALTVRLNGDLNARINFFTRVRPALVRKFSNMFGRVYEGGISEVAGLRRIGNRELVDIQTSTGTFIAEGIVTHNCYAERMAKRLQAMGQPNYANGFKLAMHGQALSKPLEWKTPQVIFVNSMSDLFHKDVPVEFIQKTFAVMRQASWHQFQILTKRSERLLELSPQIEWTDNIWMGVSIENEDYTFRIDDLRRTGAKVKFLSLEPLLGPLQRLDLRGINWVIVGGESGPGARPMDENWVKDIRDQCLAAQVPFFFKQWGGVQKKKAGRLLDGRTWDDMPVRSAAARI